MNSGLPPADRAGFGVFWSTAPIGVLPENRTVLALMVGFLSFVLAGCSGTGESTAENLNAGKSSISSPAAVVPSPNEPLRVVLIANGTNAFWETMARGLADAAKRFNASANWYGPPTADSRDQNQLMEDQASRCNGMGLSAIDPVAMAPLVNDLARTLPIVTFDSDVPGSKRLVYIGTDNYKAGAEAGRQMVRLLPHGGNVYGFVGNTNAENARERQAGFEAAVKGHNIHLVAVAPDQKDPRVAETNVRNVLQNNPGRVQGLLGLYSYNLPAIAQAVKDLKPGNRPRVVGFDADQETQDALEHGLADASIVQKPYLFGYLALEFLYYAHRDGADKVRQEWDRVEKNYPITGKDHIDTGVEVITPSTIKDFRSRLRRWHVTVS